jgi:hypothetical protein
MTKERWEKLNSIRFDWGEEPSSHEKYQRTRIGPCVDVPESRCSKANQSEGKWVTEQPFITQKGFLEKKRVVELDLNGESTDKTANSWDTLFRELLAYLQTHGDFNVPQGYPRNPLLVRWVREQRNAYALKRRGEQTSSLTPLREAKLDAIGFSWFVGVTEEDYPAEGVLSTSAPARPEKAQSGNKDRSENFGVASPDHITSG